MDPKWSKLSKILPISGWLYCKIHTKDPEDTGQITDYISYDNYKRQRANWGQEFIVQILCLGITPTSPYQLPTHLKLSRLHSSLIIISGLSGNSTHINLDLSPSCFVAKTAISELFDCLACIIQALRLQNYLSPSLCNGIFISLTLTWRIKNVVNLFSIFKSILSSKNINKWPYQSKSIDGEIKSIRFYFTGGKGK